jgi:hypothetical protein
MKQATKTKKRRKKNRQNVAGIWTALEFLKERKNRPKFPRLFLETILSQIELTLFK